MSLYRAYWPPKPTLLLAAERLEHVDAVRGRRILHEVRRPKEQPVDDAEHRRVGADPEPEGADHRDGEARLQRRPRMAYLRSCPRLSKVMSSVTPRDGPALRSSEAVARVAMLDGDR